MDELTQTDAYLSPVERASNLELRRQIEKIADHPLIDGLMNVAGGFVAVLNEHLQLLAVNEAFLRMLGLSNWETEIGLRLGETLHCVHADQTPDGCGASPFCSSCGAAVAMVAAMARNVPAERNCVITSRRNEIEADFFFRVRCLPVVVDEVEILLVFLQDFSQQQQWATLERAFFHDISNTIAAILPVSDLLAERYPADPAVEHLGRLSIRLTQEVAAQRALADTGTGSYQPFYQLIPLSRILDEVSSSFSEHELTSARLLRLPDMVPEGSIRTDVSLVVRILGNMVINALEATEAGGEVKLGIESRDGVVAFTVWNGAFIPHEIARRVFQRNFSTKKEVGRGLGTYSMKFFGERVLGGTVDFTTSEEAGTEFRLILNGAV